MAEFENKKESSDFQKILTRINSQEGYLDSVHGMDHLLRVHNFAMYLADEYPEETNKKVLSAACLLHDVRRRSSDVGDLSDRVRSSLTAREILTELSYSPDEINAVEMAILDHDQNDYTPVTMEGKILRDADILAGLGAQGILRVIIATTERGESLDKIFERLDKKMSARIKSLIFPQSRELALKEERYVRDFLGKLSDFPWEAENTPFGKMYRMLDHLIQGEVRGVASVFAISMTGTVLLTRYQDQVLEMIYSLPEEYQIPVRTAIWLGLGGFAIGGALSAIYMARTIEYAMRLNEKLDRSRGGQLE